MNFHYRSCLKCKSFTNSLPDDVTNTVTWLSFYTFKMRRSVEFLTPRKRTSDCLNQVWTEEDRYV